jgi:hypothetical protein
VDGYGTGYDPDFAGFRVTIYDDNTYTTVARTIDSEGDTSMDATSGKGVVYTVAQQAVDFGSAQTTLYYSIAARTTTGVGYAAPQVGT